MCAPLQNCPGLPKVHSGCDFMLIMTELRKLNEHRNRLVHDDPNEKP